MTWESSAVNLAKEANFLKLDCSKIKAVFDWKPRWNVAQAINEVVEWTKVYQAGEYLSAYMERQINNFGRINHE